LLADLSAGAAASSPGPFGKLGDGRVVFEASTP
jgi:hypothetical protein